MLYFVIFCFITDLELPLGGHDLGVGAADPDPGVETGAVVSLHDVPAVHLHQHLVQTSQWVRIVIISEEKS